ncbi:MAG: 3-isopropylmalate dehydratase large subunit, partial [Leptospiraceae bacterium]|nr:3-isopropylmalate dehydratase large subunit [Leptospiraceae bacterium]
MGKNLYNKVFDNHIVRELAPGQYQIFLGLHLVHEVTSPQAFQMLRENKLRVAYPNRTFATADHVIPTQAVARVPEQTSAMLAAIERNTSEFEVSYFAPGENKHGIVHVTGPEQGLTQPGMTIACGDSHTSTHGAFGALAFGIGTTQVRDVLATQTMVMHRLKVRQIKVNGRLREGVYAKDLALYILNRLGTAAGVGYAYEFEGEAVRHLNMDERMTLCNLAVEMGARCGYVNPCNTTFAYLKGKPYAPGAEDWDRALAYWKSIASDPDAHYDDVVEFDASEVQPMVTWGITPAQSVAVHDCIPELTD